MQTQRLDLVGPLSPKRFTTFQLALTFRQTNGEPLDFTGCQAQAQIRASYDAVTFTAFTTTFDSDRATGQLNLTLEAPNYLNLPSGKYVWDLILRMADGTDWSPLEGDCIIKATATQWQTAL